MESISYGKRKQMLREIRAMVEELDGQRLEAVYALVYKLFMSRKK